MITEIPTADEFHEAGLNLLHMAWEIAAATVTDFEQIEEWTGGPVEKSDAEAYWQKAQPTLGNAFGLIQQGMELALKARIAAVSPYLLIDRNPKDWPSGVDSKPVPFSDFRTLDAADLVKVHNTFCANPLGEKFRVFFDGVRRQRNTLMHSVPKHVFKPTTLVSHVLTAAAALFDEQPWPSQCIDMLEESRFAAVGVGVDDTYNTVMAQIDAAIRHLSPAEAKEFFGFDKKQHAYVCPVCRYKANRDYQTDFPALAQLTEKSPTATDLRCVVCSTVSKVERTKCINCDGNVISDEGECLLCGEAQET